MLTLANRRLIPIGGRVLSGTALIVMLVSGCATDSSSPSALGGSPVTTPPTSVASTHSPAGPTTPTSAPTDTAISNIGQALTAVHGLKAGCSAQATAFLNTENAPYHAFSVITTVAAAKQWVAQQQGVANGTFPSTGWYGKPDASLMEYCLGLGDFQGIDIPAPPGTDVGSTGVIGVVVNDDGATFDFAAHALNSLSGLALPGGVTKSAVQELLDDEIVAAAPSR